MTLTPILAVQSQVILHTQVPHIRGLDPEQDPDQSQEAVEDLTRGPHHAELLVREGDEA